MNDRPYPPVREEYPYPASTDRGPGLGLDQVVRTLLRRWWYPVAGALLVFGIAWFQLPEELALYQATVTVQLVDPRQSITGGLTIRNEPARAPDVASQLHVIRSQAVIGQVVDTLGLRVQAPPELRGLLDDARVAPSVAPGTLRLAFAGTNFTVERDGRTANGSYGTPFEIDGVRFAVAARPPVDSASLAIISREAAIMGVAGNLTAVVRPQTFIIDISYADPDPYLAQRIANTVAEAYQFHSLAGVREASHRRTTFVQSQWEAAEARHAEAQQRLNQYRVSRGSYGSQERLRQQQSALFTADAERQRLVSERAVFQSFIERVADAGDEGVYQELRTLVLAPGITASPLLSQLYTDVTEYQQEREQLLAAGRAPTHPDIERLDRLMGSARATVLDAARTHLASVDLRITNLDEQRRQSAAELQGLPLVESDDLALSQEVTAARSLADMLRDEYQRARIAEAVDAGQAEVLEYSSAATPLPAGRRSQKLAISLALGLFLGCGMALGLETFSGTVRWRGEMEQMGAGPGLAVIPRISEPSKGWTRIFHRNGKSDRLGPSDPSGLSAPGIHPEGAEAYRILRTNLTFLRRDQALGALTITSANVADGKSTTAANLAIALARHEMRVLLVDGDLRRPKQHRIFKTASAPGFADVLTGKVSHSAAIHSTGVSGLFLMPRGRFEEEAAENLGGRRLEQLLTAVRKEFDVILVDTPPVLVAADATSIAALTDGVLLVVRAGSTQKEAVRRTVQQLQGVGANAIGFVLNDPETVAEKYGDYKYSREYYAVET